MTDFLTNLAARTIAAPSLRPRLRMRFESTVDPPPQVADKGTGATGAPDAGSGAPLPAQREPAAFFPGAVPEIPRPVSPVLAARQEGVSGAPAEPEILHPPAAPTVLTSPRPVESPRETKVESTPAVRDEPEQTAQVDAGFAPRVAARPAPAHERIVEHVTARAAPAARAARQPDVLHNALADPAPAAQQTLPPHRHESQRPRVEQRPTRVDRDDWVHVNAQPSSAARRHRPTAAGARASASDAEPVVHVSIGRVEVRAVTPPASAGATGRRNSAMTIDEYVARRRERR